jgi:protein-disulfide isomerase
VLRVEPQIIETYVASGQVSLAYHPMVDFGEAALQAHRAAQCAGEQSPIAFWLLHDILFERQSELRQATAESLAGWVEEIGYSRNDFLACMADGAVTEKVQRLDDARREAGIRARPSFDINGQVLQGGLPFPLLAEAIESALNE